jgi:hypothetical protein
MKNYFDEEFVKILSKLPDLQKFKESLIELEELDLSNCTLDQIHSNYFDRAILLPNQGIIIPNNESDSNYVYRARFNINENEENLKLIRTFSYPDPSLCKKNGRGNLKNMTVFYCADIPLTAFLESRPKINDVGYMGKWRLKCNRELTCVAFFPTDISKKNYWYQTAINQQQRMLEEVKKIKSEKSPQLEYLFNYTSKIFTHERNPYPLSSWIAYKMLYNFNFIDFLVYPSSMLNSDSCNLAFHPNFVDRYFELISVFKFKVTDLQINTATYEIINIGKPDRTNLIWGLPTQDDIYPFN